MFTNVSFSYESRPTELDCVIVNKYGVFIIEVKNYSGYIVGNEKDYEWKKYKRTEAGNMYMSTVKNPIKQVERQTHLLAKYLKSYGIDVWVKGYVMLMHNNSPVYSEQILSDIVKVDISIHTKDSTLLSESKIEEIKRLFY